MVMLTTTSLLCKYLAFANPFFSSRGRCSTILCTEW